MTRDDPPITVRRILIALDTSADSLAGLDAAVRLAAKLGAEVPGLFVEDRNLLRVAKLEVSRRIVPISGDARELEPGELERHIKAQGRRARRELRAAGLLPRGGEGGLLVAPGPQYRQKRRAVGKLLRGVGCSVIVVWA